MSAQQRSSKGALACRGQRQRHGNRPSLGPRWSVERGGGNDSCVAPASTASDVSWRSTFQQVAFRACADARGGTRLSPISRWTVYRVIPPGIVRRLWSSALGGCCLKGGLQQCRCRRPAPCSAALRRMTSRWLRLQHMNGWRHSRNGSLATHCAIHIAATGPDRCSHLLWLDARADVPCCRRCFREAGG